jgi:hypothetical protein
MASHLLRWFFVNSRRKAGSVPEENFMRGFLLSAVVFMLIASVAAKGTVVHRSLPTAAAQQFASMQLSDQP